MSSTYTPENGSIVMFSTEWCGYCRRLSLMLDHEGIDYTVIDIENDEKAAALVGSVNGGNHVVPTVLFADGSTATNPSINDVKAKLAS